MSRKRTAILTAGLAGAAVAGVVGRTVLNSRRRKDPEAHERLSLLPPEDLGPARSFDGTELAVRAAGRDSDPLLVFAHGFSLDMTSWHYQWTGLSGRFRCVLLDFRSHGRSGRAAGGDLSPMALGHDLAAVLDLVAAERPAVVVGHSMGAMAMLAMAESRPDLLAGRVAGAVFAGAASNDLLRGAMGAVTELLRRRARSDRRRREWTTFAGTCWRAAWTSVTWLPGPRSSGPTPRRTSWTTWCVWRLERLRRSGPRGSPASWTWTCVTRSGTLGSRRSCWSASTTG
jgi:pimeloyl-ACP methyl ester carboxylesterase